MPSDAPVLPREFYLTSAVVTAEKLLGAVLTHDSPEGLTAGRIVETEAYAGRSDAACHSYKISSVRDSHRTNIMFGPGGFAYVYLIYGMYNCFNVVANIQDEPEAVLIRAIEPTCGIPLMEERRGISGVRKLCGGPGKLCIAMNITRELYGADLCGTRLFITHGTLRPEESVLSTKRINVDYSGEAADYKYRFVIRESGFLSTRKFIENSGTTREKACKH
ncbi:MAG: DNA-3-methyladenine glycosylase [Synergistaceae bacterium]|jgi:DNA-3-methyladenine glycosylase|nr:DNA-3-methyladenine glycosylase [Synergistaceae bacterium]